MCYAVPTFQLKVWFPLASRKTTGNVVARRRQVFCLVALFFIFKWVVDEGKNSSLGIMSSVFHQGWCEDLIPKSSLVDAIAFSIWLFISFTLKSKKTERRSRYYLPFTFIHLPNWLSFLNCSAFWKEVYAAESSQFLLHW